MARSSARSKKKVSGGIYRNFRKKRKHELASNPTLTKIGSLKKKKERLMKFRMVYVQNVVISLI